MKASAVHQKDAAFPVPEAPENMHRSPLIFPDTSGTLCQPVHMLPVQPPAALHMQLPALPESDEALIPSKPHSPC